MCCRPLQKCGAAVGQAGRDGSLGAGAIRLTADCNNAGALSEDAAAGALGDAMQALSEVRALRGVSLSPAPSALAGPSICELCSVSLDIAVSSADACVGGMTPEALYPETCRS